MKGRVCELCNEEASLYCGSDSAFLCWSCDARVHGANFLVARHVRHTLCSECNGLAGDTFFGVGFQPHRLICRSCSSEVESETSTDHDSKSSSSSCVSTTESAPRKGGVSRRKAERTGFTSSVSAVSGVDSRFPSKLRARSSVDAKAEDILVNWCRKLGLNGSCTSVASHALGVCLVKLTVLPLRVSLVAAISYAAKLSGDRSAYTPQNLKRLVEISGVPCEIHLLKTMKHNNIMKFYTSWVDTANRNINFVTEMFTSGTLRQYRQKHKRVNIRAVKHWCRQILRGLLYLHSHDPPVIHRDLKCDNIFVNGNQGEVKIGDLGLAAILRKSHAAHCVGTPEFMAPEVYEEEYNELVDIYSFGMCILEMVTFEYPYSECTHPAQIYKKVISGKKPDALYKVKDPEVREFVEKCLASVSLRLSARELLQDPFLRVDDCESDLRPIECRGEPDDMVPLLRQPFLEYHHSNSSFSNGYSNAVDFDAHNGWGYQPLEMEPTGIELFEYHEDEHPANVDISIKGKRREDDGIFLRLRIADKEDHIRNIYFPFDIEMDTALSVATEMVAELDITDQDVTKIADMIDGEIASLVPEWKPGPGIEETPCFATLNLCHNCVSNHTSNGSLMDILANNPGAKNLQIFQCSNGCAAMHGRFEEITYQVDGADHHIPEGQSEELHCTEIWYKHESRELSSVSSGESPSDEEYEKINHSIIKDERGSGTGNVASNVKNSISHLRNPSSSSAIPSMSCALSDDYENEIQQVLRWLKAKHQMEMRGLRDLQLGFASKPSSLDNRQLKPDNEGLFSTLSNTSQGHNNGLFLKSSAYDKHFTSNCATQVNKCSPDLVTHGARNCEANKGSRSAEDMVHVVTAKSFYTAGSLLPCPIHRTMSLPVDAVDI